MNKILAVAGYEVRKTVRRKAFLFLTIAVPLLLVAAVFIALPLLPQILGSLGGVVGAGTDNIGYVDTLGFLEPSGGILEFGDESAARQSMEGGNISAFFIPGEGYLEDGNVTLYVSGGTLGFNDPSGRISYFMRDSLVKYWNISGSEAALITSPANLTTVNLKGGGALGGAGGPMEFALPYALAFLLLITIMMSSGYLMQGIGEEKENRTGEILLSSISADQLLRGKILGYGSLGLLQAVMYALAGILLIYASPLSSMFAGLQLTGVAGIGIVYFVMGYALFASSIAATASISSSAKEAQQTSMLFTMMAIIPIALVSLIVLDPNSALAQVLTYIPYTSPFVVMMRMSLTAVPMFEIAASLIILAASIFLASKLAGRIFRMGMLKYGSRASLREVLGFIREK
jgi:ABC-2 type transport system permease protein